MAKPETYRQASDAVNYSLCKLMRNLNELHDLGILVETIASTVVRANDRNY